MGGRGGSKRVWRRKERIRKKRKEKRKEKRERDIASEESASLRVRKKKGFS